MKKIIFVILFLPLVIWGQENSNTLDSLRYLYFEEWTGACGAVQLVNYTMTFPSDPDPVWIAYSGAGLATTANCTSWPLARLNRFNAGKKLLEEALDKDPGNMEIRFLRYSIQKNIPAFLGYDNTETDRRIILDQLTLQLDKGGEDYLLEQILHYFRNEEGLTAEQIKNRSYLSRHDR